MMCHPRRKEISINPQHYFSKLCCFLMAFWPGVSHVSGHQKTFNQYKYRSWDNTGEPNVVSDLTISAQKYPKIVKQPIIFFLQGIRNTVF